jgi:hypothetical protein
MNSLAAISKTILRDSELVESSSAFDSLCTDCTELIKLLTASAKTAKGKN